MVNVGAIFGRNNRKQEQSVQVQEDSHSQSRSDQQGPVSLEERSESKNMVITEKDSDAFGVEKTDLEKVASFGHKEDAIFERAKKAQLEAEEAAKTASENAEKAFKLLSVAEGAREEAEDLRTHHDSLVQKIDDTRIADVEAKAKKDELAELLDAIKERGQTFDEARSDARALGKQVKKASQDLQDMKDNLGELQGNLDATQKEADHYNQHLKDFEGKKPGVDDDVKTAYKVVSGNGQDLKRLASELSEAAKHADDLERQAREARQKANDKKAELDNAEEKKTVVIADHEKKKAAAADLDKKIADLQKVLGEKDDSIKEITGKKEAQQADIDELTAKLEGLQNDGKIKDEEAREKHKAYDEVENKRENLQKEAADAAAAQTEAQKTRADLTEELEDYHRRLTKAEAKTAESTQEAKKALELAKSSDKRKHKCLETAAKAQKEADDLTHKKIATAESVLATKLSDLTEHSEEVQKEPAPTNAKDIEFESQHVDYEGPATSELVKDVQQSAETAKSEAPEAPASAPPAPPTPPAPSNNGRSAPSQATPTPSGSGQKGKESDVKGKVVEREFQAESGQTAASQAKGKLEESSEAVKQSALDTRESGSKKTSR